MSSSTERNSNHSPHAVGSELHPMSGGRWHEIQPEALSRRHLSKRAGEAQTEAIEAPVPEEPQDSKGPQNYTQSYTGSEPPKQGTPKPAVATGGSPGAAGGSTVKVVRLERRQELEHRLKGSPTDLDAFMELGRIYRVEDRPADARRVFHQALQMFPDEKQLLWEHEEAILARSLQQLREISDVARRLDTAESDRELKRCQNDWACRRMDVCRARLARDASLNHLRVVLGEAMYDAGLYEGAIEELQSVLEIDELSPTAYLIQGRCLLEMGREVEAMASLRAASLRRSVVAPTRIRVIALRLLCETAERLGINLTLAQYRQQLQKVEQGEAQ